MRSGSTFTLLLFAMVLLLGFSNPASAQTPLRCATNYQLVNGECVVSQNCGRNAFRNKEGDCDCNPGYRMRGRSCVAARPTGGGSGLTTVCIFTFGPMRGQTIDYKRTPGIQPIQVGAPCQDGRGSTGYAGAPR